MKHKKKTRAGFAQKSKIEAALEKKTGEGEHLKAGKIGKLKETKVVVSNIGSLRIEGR